jgi:hypothetical protein
MLYLPWKDHLVGESRKVALNWTWLSCHDFVDNQVRLQLFALAYNLGNFLRRLALPPAVEHRTQTTLRDKLIKIGAKVAHHARWVVFQLAEVAIPGPQFAAILRRVERLRLQAPTWPLHVWKTSNSRLVSAIGLSMSRRRST